MAMVRSTGVLPLGSRAALRRYAGPGSSGLGMSAASHTILEHLLKTEGSAEGLYKEMAEKAKGEGFRTIFTMLAREEAKHTEWIKQLARDGFLGPAVKHNDEILGDAKKIIAAMKDTHNKLDHLCSKPDYTEPIELYRMAANMEAQSAEFYAARAVVAQEPPLRKLLEVIAAEEAKHYALVSGLLQFVTEDDESREMEQPNFWVRPRTDNIVDMGKL